MRKLILPLVVFLAVASNTQAQLPPRQREAVLVEQATSVLAENTKANDHCIPASLLQKAQGVLIVPHVVKAGLVVGGHHGRGVLLVRCRDGSWGNPVFVDLTGASVGLQAGISSTDVVLVFRTWPSVERLLRGRDKLTLGGDAAIAAGPVGRQATASTDALLRAEVYSYSRSRGLFAGVSLEGDALYVDWNANDRYYGRRGVTPLEAVSGVGVFPPETAIRLRLLIMNVTAAPPPPMAPVLVPEVPRP